MRICAVYGVSSQRIPISEQPVFVECQKINWNQGKLLNVFIADVGDAVVANKLNEVVVYI